MSQATMRTDLLQSLEIVTKLAVHTVGQDLAVLAIHDIALTIEKPGGDFVLSGILDDGDDSLELFGSEFTGAAGIEHRQSLPSRVRRRRFDREWLLTAC